MYYSQNAEERAILAACPESTGRFLDIGAWNAICMSNTRALFEQGWGGVLVEPSPLPFAKIQAEYADVPDRITVINAAVGIEDVESVEMWITEDAVSTSDETAHHRWRNTAKYESERMTVSVITLERLFAEHGEFDFINIDTEGSSVDLCLRLLTLGYRPRCICVEHDERVVEVLGVANAAGYVCSYASGENLVLVKQ